MSPDQNALKIFGRLKKAVQSETDAGLAKALGISQASVAASKKKGQIPPAWIVNISKKFKVSADWLLYGEGGDAPPSHNRASTTTDNSFPQSPTTWMEKVQEGLIKPTILGDFYSLFKDDYSGSMLGPTLMHGSNGKPLVSIPILDTQFYSDIEAGDEYYEFDVAFFRASWISEFGSPDKMFIFIQKDDSMRPYIHRNDAVLIDRYWRPSRNGTMVAIAIDDDISIRKIERKPGRILFRALNTEYMDIEIDTDQEEQNSIIIGRVLWWCHKEA